MKGSILNKHRELKTQADKIPTLVNMVRDRNNGFIKALEEWIAIYRNDFKKIQLPRIFRISWT